MHTTTYVHIICMCTEHIVQPLLKDTPNNYIKDTIESTSLQRTLSKAPNMDKWTTSLQWTNQVVPMCRSLIYEEFKSHTRMVLFHITN